MRRCLISISFVLLLIGQALGQAPGSKLLIARTVGEHILSDGDTVRTFGFTESLGAKVNVPAPTIWMNENDSFIVDLWNMSQGMPHTIHLHGLDVDQQNDGVPQLSFIVNHTMHGFYHFRAPHAGTYMYHCHVVSPVHVQAGMYGMLIVNAVGGANTAWTGGPAYNKQRVWMLAEMDKDWHHDTMLMHDSTAGAKIPIPKYDPNHFQINGRSDHQLNDTSVQILAKANSAFYLRIGNMGYYGNRIVFPPALNAQIIASDGRDLPSAEVKDTLWLYPGERYGVMLYPTTEFIDSIEVGYQNLNTRQIDSTQYVKATIAGWQGIEEQTLDQPMIGPNPTDDAFVVSLSTEPGNKVAIELYGIDGRQVRQWMSTVDSSGNLRFTGSIGDLASGTYVIAVTTAEGRVVRKLVKS